MPRSLLEALQELGRDNPVTRAGQYWAQDNAAFEQTNPTLGERAWRAVNPMTALGSAMGAMHDGAGRGSIPEMGLALAEALPVFGAARNIKTVFPLGQLEHFLQMSNWIKSGQRAAVNTTGNVAGDLVQKQLERLP